jgi:peptide/nickel transport system permease protein
VTSALVPKDGDIALSIRGAAAGTLVEAPDPRAAAEHLEGRTGRPPGRVAWDRLKRDKVAVVCGIVILFFVLVALFAPLLTALEAVDPVNGTKADPYTPHPELVDLNGFPTEGTSAAHWLGVEKGLGRDLFARWTHGARPCSSSVSRRRPFPRCSA